MAHIVEAYTKCLQTAPKEYVNELFYEDYKKMALKNQKGALRFRERIWQIL